MLKGGPGIWVLLAQGGGRYLCLLLARDAQPHPCCSGLAQGGRKSPAGHFPGTSSEGLCSAFSSGLKWKHFKGLCLFFFFFFPFFFFLCKQLITSLKGSSSPPSLLRSLEAINIKQLSAGIKLYILFCLKLRWLLFGVGFFTSFLE